MSRRGRKISSVVLAALMVLAGASIDLCACDAAAHGYFCPEDQAASHCAPVEPAPSSCCAGALEERAPDGPQVRATSCDCPVIDLALPPAEAPEAQVAHDGPAATLAATHADASLASSLTSLEVVAWPPRREAGPPRGHSGPLPRHLELHVLRC